MTETYARSNIDYLSLAAASIAGTCNVLSWIFTNYLIYVEQQDASLLYTIYLAAFDGSFYLTPLLVVILFRRVASITLPYALVLFIILMGRTYYLVQLKLVGLNGLVQPFDVPDILSIVLSAVSAAVILLWVGVGLITAVVNKMARKWGA